MRRLASLERRTPSRTWPLLGMLVLGLVAGAALGGYAMSQRSQLKRFATYAGRVREAMARMGRSELESVDTAKTPRTNHRRKATSEV